MRTRSFRSSIYARLIVGLLAGFLVTACGGDDDDESPTSPTPPTGTAGSTVLVIENFTATSTAGTGGTFTYRASLRLRETGGGAATITGVTLTLTQPSGVTVSQDVSPADAFPGTTVAANGTLTSNTLSVSNAPLQASQVAVRITFTGTVGASSTVQSTATVTPG
jgi:hypothetical protein